MKKNSFHKAERLKSRKAIESLFKEGCSLKAFPYVLLFREVESSEYPALMTVAVPKKLIRKAVDRNLLKRRTREAYRLLKHELYTVLRKKGKQYELLFLYQSQDIVSYKKISSSVERLISRLP